MAKRIAVSACLLGERCRYDGGHVLVPEVVALSSACELVPICPERLGGLTTPRNPSEIVSRDPLVVKDREGKDCTVAFSRGAQIALDIASSLGCDAAILKSKSPSCGAGVVYDGSFSGALVPGWGVAAQLFRDAGIPVADETTFQDLLS